MEIFDCMIAINFTELFDNLYWKHTIQSYKKYLIGDVNYPELINYLKITKTVKSMTINWILSALFSLFSISPYDI